MKQLIIMLGLVMGLLASGVNAQNWQGAYMGLGFGGVFDNHKVTGISGFGTDGYSGTLIAGYDFVPTNSKLLFGVWTQGDLNSAVTKIGSAEFNRQGDWAIGGRAGYIVAPNVLLYGAVGYTQAYYDTNIPHTGLGNIEGVTYGGGAELQVTNGLFSRLEYRHDDYNPAGFSSGKDTVTDNQIMAVISIKLNGNSGLFSSTKDSPVSSSGYTPLK